MTPSRESKSVKSLLLVYSTFFFFIISLSHVEDWQETCTHLSFMRIFLFLLTVKIKLAKVKSVRNDPYPDLFIIFKIGSFVLCNRRESRFSEYETNISLLYSSLNNPVVRDDTSLEAGSGAVKRGNILLFSVLCTKFDVVTAF